MMTVQDTCMTIHSDLYQRLDSLDDHWTPELFCGL
jgi:hypothetical protein